MEREWSLFLFDDVFTHHRGKRLIQTNQVPGDIAYISSTKRNNGLSAYISPPDFMVRYRDKITLANSGSVGSCFFHSYEFVASDHVTIIGLKDSGVTFNANIALFLKPILESMGYKYNFGREISDARLSREHILLPVNKVGSPDWDYMNEQTLVRQRQIKFQRLETSSVNTLKLATGSWKEFRLDSIFEIKKGKRLTAAEQIDGSTPYIGAISTDNGVANYIAQDPIHDGNTISLSYNGSIGEAFYQASPFWATDDVNVLYFRPENGIQFNKYIALFFCTLLRLEGHKYSYGRKWVLESMKSTIVKLPVTSAGTPDWDYMEMYIKALPYGDKIS